MTVTFLPARVLTVALPSWRSTILLGVRKRTTPPWETISPERVVVGCAVFEAGVELLEQALKNKTEVSNRETKVLCIIIALA